MAVAPKLEIRERLAFAGGQSFGESGAYEYLTGRAHFAIDPGAEGNRGIVDIDKAPRCAQGHVHVTADIAILKPVDLAKGNRRIFFDWGNRGNKRAIQFFNDAAGGNRPLGVEHAGNGFLMRRGYAIVWLAWQGDLLPGDGRMILDLPVATEGGRPITGKVRVEYIADAQGETTYPLSGRASTRSHPTVSRDTRKASLTRRRYPYDEPIPVSPDAWSFARLEGGRGLDAVGAETAVVPSDQHIHMPAGFEPGWIYELVYEGRDPLVLGLGHAVVRDIVSFLKHDTSAANPLAEGGVGMEKAYGWGRSQTGRCIRDFIYRGFNADTSGRRVFDGLMPHVSGGGRMWLNHRFANVIVSAGQQYEDHFNPADAFPFSYASSTDHVTGRTDAILKRPQTDPLVMHTQTCTEYWQRRGSLVHTDTQGNDLQQPDTVRVYHWSSSQHFADPRPRKPETPAFLHNPTNIVWTSMLFRAALDAMDRWASEGTSPPASRIPRRADGTLVDFATWRQQFPVIPGALAPTSPNLLPQLDFGPAAAEGIFDEPPRVVQQAAYAVLVPAVDADGNDTAGVRVPMVTAPLATYTGWNVRPRGFGHGALHEFTGSTLPFPATESERTATADPRPSVRSRYASRAAYVAAIRRAAEQLVADGLMLAEDVERCAAAAENWGAPRHRYDLD
ncbi:MAG: hypothetical protein KDJ41_16740 [Hyphomicrobiaceae bacterium]|nr:hypothetical protein [Hyphomicrobiaceae bacterium]